MCLFYFIESNRKNLEEIVAYMDIDTPASSTKNESDSNKNVIHNTEVRRKTMYDQVLNNRIKCEMEINQMSNLGDDSSMEGTSIIHTKLPPGKVSVFFICIIHNCSYIEY